MSGLYSMWCGSRSQHTAHRWTLKSHHSPLVSKAFDSYYLGPEYQSHELRMTCDGAGGPTS